MIGKKFTSHRLLEYPNRKGETEFFGNGTYYFEKLFSDLSHAKSTIHLSFYRFKHDSSGKQLLDVLKQKAAEGVKVRLLLDLFGSLRFPQDAVKDLKENGIEFAYSHIPSFPLIFTTLNRRNHHKIVVIDGRLGFVGGFNVGDNYAEKDSQTGFWRDYMVRIKGSGAEDLQKQFLEDWAKAGMDIGKTDNLFPELREGSTAFRLAANSGGSLDTKLLDLIQSANKRIIIGSPYFIPTAKVARALIKARNRGVKIIVILPEKADHILVKERALTEFTSLIQEGITLFLYQKGFYHAKLMLVDQQAAYVGTSNFDIRSFRTNDEMVLFTEDPTMLREIEINFHEDLECSKKQELSDVKAGGILSKVKRGLAYVFTNFL